MPRRNVGGLLLLLLTACADPGPVTPPTPLAPTSPAPAAAASPTPFYAPLSATPPADTAPAAPAPAATASASPPDATTTTLAAGTPAAPSTTDPPAPATPTPSPPTPATPVGAAPSATTTAAAGKTVSCIPMPVAPGSFPNPSATPGLAGVVAPGFLGLHDDKGVYQIAHGVDLSDNNSPDYDKLKTCGAEFAIIKLYPSKTKFNLAQIRALSQRQIATVPYYYLSMPTTYKYFPEKFSSDEALESIIIDTTAIGQADAQAFLKTYTTLFGGNGSVTIAGLSGVVIALDVEEAFQTSTEAAVKARTGYPALNESAISANALDRYGQAYSAMVVSWVKTIQSAQPDATILFYTNPAMYTTYLIAARSADFAVINGMPVWLAEYTVHGGDIDDASAATREGAQQLCSSASAGNKCIIHQYTARGAFGGVSATAYTDLNRFFPVDKVTVASGVQYVRKIAYVGAQPASAAPGSTPTPTTAPGSAPAATASVPPTPASTTPP